MLSFNLLAFHDVKNQSSIHMIETMLKSTKLNDFISDAYSPYYNEAFSWGASHLQSDMKWKSALKNEDMLKNRMQNICLKVYRKFEDLTFEKEVPSSPDPSVILRAVKETFEETLLDASPPFRSSSDDDVDYDPTDCVICYDPTHGYEDSVAIGTIIQPNEPRQPAADIKRIHHCCLYRYYQESRSMVDPTGTGRKIQYIELPSAVVAQYREERDERRRSENLERRRREHQEDLKQGITIIIGFCIFVLGGIFIVDNSVPGCELLCNLFHFLITICFLILIRALTGVALEPANRRQDLHMCRDICNRHHNARVNGTAVNATNATVQ
jgi:hypothetical protein